MFSKLTFFVAAAFAASVAAGPINNSCTTAPVQCCNSLYQPNSTPAPVATLLGLLGVVVGDITAQVGLNCNPITVIGVGSGAKCATSPVCCTDVFGGDNAVGVNCSPVSVNL